MLKLIGVFVGKRVLKKVTNYIGGAIAAAGGAAAVNPELLELIPENLRGYVIGGLGLAVIFARQRREFLEEWRNRKE